jgi:EF hand
MTSSFKTFFSSTVLVLAGSMAFSALAQTPAAPAVPASGARPHGKNMKELDTNKDKMISRDEAKGRPHLTKNFDAIDTNKDGQLSRDEMKAYRKAHKGEHKGERKGEGKPPVKN